MAEDLVGAQEVASMLGITRQRVNAIVRSHDEFPEPVSQLAAGRVWRRKDIIKWADKTGRTLQTS
jgi:prophage regulatory protein